MEYDNYILNDNGSDITIYPMAELSVKNDKFVIYVKDIKDEYSPDDFYVGQVKNDTLLPVKASLIKEFEIIFDVLIRKIIETKRD